MKVTYKIWLDQGGKVFGDEPYELLQRVKKMGSIHQAANQMGMSYSKAWRLIRTLEEKLGFTLLQRNIGGNSGRGSHVSPITMDLMSHYKRFRKDVKEAIE
jgi:molybdate transport system regulatory protein